MLHVKRKNRGEYSRHLIIEHFLQMQLKNVIFPLIPPPPFDDIKLDSDLSEEKGA